MDDSSDGSSSAAQGAQRREQEDVEEESGGFLRRFLDNFSSADDDEEDAHHGEASAQGAGALTGLGSLAQLRVEDVAIPKSDIVSVPVDISMCDLVNVFRDSGYTRLPVYEGTLDTPVGMAHLKDFALQYGFNGDHETFAFAEMLRPLLFVPPSMRIGVLLQKMQSERRHMALVIDEYGGVDGLVTIEDLVEQVVGEIEDEHDVDEGHFWTTEKPGCYIALAKTPLTEFEAAIGRSLTDHEAVDEEEIDTLGGLVFMLLGRVPARGEVAEHPGGAQIEVLEADPRRIKRLRVRLTDPK